MKKMEKRVVIKRITPFELGFILFVLFLIVFGVGASRGLLKGGEVADKAWKRALTEVSREYKTLDTLEKIVVAESAGKHKGVWGRAGEYGLAQFQPKTFYWLADKAGLKNPDWKSWQDQIVVLNFAVRNGYANHWTTYQGK